MIGSGAFANPDPAETPSWLLDVDIFPSRFSFWLAARLPAGHWIIGRGLYTSRRVRRSLSCSSRMFTRLSYLTASTRSRAFSRRPRNRQSPFTGRVSPSTFPKTPFAGCHIESRSAVASRGGLASGLYSALYSPFWHLVLILTTSTPEASCRRMAGSRDRLDSSCFADTERRRSTTSRKTSGRSLLRLLLAQRSCKLAIPLSRNKGSVRRLDGHCWRSRLSRVHKREVIPARPPPRDFPVHLDSLQSWPICAQQFVEAFSSRPASHRRHLQCCGTQIS